MSQSVLQQLISKLGVEKVLNGNDLHERYDHIWRMNIPLSAKALVLPRTTEEVSAILKICHAQNQPVVIHGGLTGLVGGTETQKHEIVISTEKMNSIEELDEKSRTITVQAGVILENIHRKAKEKDLMFPMTFGAKGSAQIGGVIATNAGGLRVFRYGMTRNMVLGLEAVLADGTVISSMKKLIKDNSGYDLKQIFIGSEGTLGVVTKAILKLEEAPLSRISAFVSLNNFEEIIELLKFVDLGLSENLTGFELIWSKTYEALTGENTSVKPPIPYGCKYYVLIEMLGTNQIKDSEKFNNLIEVAFEKNLIEDAAFAETGSDLNWFWRLREDVQVLTADMSFHQDFDISIPLNFIEKETNNIINNLEKMKEVESVFTFGHLADGNIHFIVGKKDDSKELTKKINEVVYAPLKKVAGSISAEHGIGKYKKQYLPISRSANEITLMKLLKKSLDPKGILNMGKII
ncbi:FAD-binding oxidoreductase [Hyunsoonleella sp. 2307UL5-6]|uniref:FAD-binding oxidoreductase n=1 Tax=Hyunsoonleella sp. 2307UL5-6 TaxID=3384768 RepID=UPI0039BD4D69